LFLVCGCFLRQILGVCSIRIFAKNMGDPYYEPIIVVHDTCGNLFSKRRASSKYPKIKTL